MKLKQRVTRCSHRLCSRISQQVNPFVSSDWPGSFSIASDITPCQFLTQSRIQHRDVLSRPLFPGTWISYFPASLLIANSSPYKVLPL